MSSLVCASCDTQSPASARVGKCCSDCNHSAGLASLARFGTGKSTPVGLSRMPDSATRSTAHPGARITSVLRLPDQYADVDPAMARALHAFDCSSDDDVELPPAVAAPFSLSSPAVRPPTVQPVQSDELDMAKYGFDLSEDETEQAVSASEVLVVSSDPVQFAQTQRNKRMDTAQQRLSKAAAGNLQELQQDLLFKQQRGVRGHYSNEFAFPHRGKGCRTSFDITDNESCKAVNTYICKGVTKCPGGCLSGLDAMDVMRLRTVFVHNYSEDASRRQWLHQALFPAFVRQSGAWRKLSVPVTPVHNVDVCPSAFGLLYGFLEHTLYDTMKKVSKGTEDLICAPASKVACPVSMVKVKEEASLEYSLLRGYVAGTLLKMGEMNPAPLGMSRKTETVIVKKPWSQHWEDCKAHFATGDPPRAAPGDADILRMIIQREIRLVRKTVSSHPKCKKCCLLDSFWHEAVRMRGAAGVMRRKALRSEFSDHERLHMGERGEVDKESVRSLRFPDDVWVIYADAATQRNFCIPKLASRPPSQMNGSTTFNFKLFATYAVGLGFTPFLLHESCPAGANLVWTAVWRTIELLNAKHAFTATELFILLDNTTGDNKNMTMIAFCAWLVRTGKFLRVRVFFLMVGHTHVVIDQIFGVVTQGLRTKEIMLPETLMRIIDGTMDKNPQYEADRVVWLRSVFNWTKFLGSHVLKVKNVCAKNLSVVDENGNMMEDYNGMHDFIFYNDLADLQGTFMQYRVASTESYMPSDGRRGVLVFKEGPARDEKPEYVPLKDPTTWVSRDNKKKLKVQSNKDSNALVLVSNTRDSVANTVQMAIGFAKYLDDAQDCAAKWTLILQTIARYATSGLEPEISSGFGMECLEFVDWVHVRTSREARPAKQLPDGIIGGARNPAIDPVVHGRRSQADVDRLVQQLRDLQRQGAGPTIEPTSPVYVADYLIVRLLSGPVALVKVDSATTSLSCPGATNAVACSVHTHSANPERALGLWGHFNLQRGSRTSINRCDILVYNARVHKSDEGLFAHRTTLKALARALPDDEEYAFELPLPETHAGQDSDDSASSDEEHHEPVRRRRQSAQEAKPEPGKKRAKARHSKAQSKRKGRGARDESSEEDVAIEKDGEEEGDEEASDSERDDGGWGTGSDEDDADEDVYADDADDSDDADNAPRTGNLPPNKRAKKVVDPPPPLPDGYEHIAWDSQSSLIDCPVLLWSHPLTPNDPSNPDWYFAVINKHPVGKELLKKEKFTHHAYFKACEPYPRRSKGNGVNITAALYDAKFWHLLRKLDD